MEYILNMPPNSISNPSLMSRESSNCVRAGFYKSPRPFNSFTHRNGVIHGDLTSSNIFLDSNLDPKIADFAGSSLDQSPLLLESPASYCYPGSSLSVQGDIFAFGSLVYEIMTGESPYEGKDGDEVRALFLKNIFPDTTQLGPLGHIIDKCWRGEYGCCDGLLMNPNCKSRD